MINIDYDNKQQYDRYYGIDLLRIISMLMVVMLHINEHGGILYIVQKETLHWYVSNTIEQLCRIAVNLFALISGFVNYGKKFKIKNIIRLYIQVWFYSFIISLIFYIKKEGSIDFDKLIASLVPVMSFQYWYFSAYFFMFFLMPFLNMIIDKLNRKSCLMLIVFYLFVCSVLGDKFNAFALERGYCAMWLMVLYVLGAYIKKYDLSLTYKGCEVSPFVYLFLYITLVILQIYIIDAEIEGFERSRFYSYTYIFNVLTTITLFLFFAKIKIKNNIILQILSRVSFGVYIISEQPLIREKFITNYFKQFVETNAFYMLFIMIVSNLLIYLICGIIEFARQILFKLVGIEKLVDKLSIYFNKYMEKYILKDEGDNISLYN